jgi:hypothetical protein
MTTRAGIFAVLIFLLAVGCTSRPAAELPANAYYTKSAEDIAGPAFLLGWKRENKVSFMSDYLSWAEVIDGKVVKSGMSRWHQPIAIETGKREIVAIFEMGARRATAELSFVAEPGKAYQVVHRCDDSRLSWVEFWIQEMESREAVSDVVHVETSGRTAYVPIFL